MTYPGFRRGEPTRGAEPPGFSRLAHPTGRSGSRRRSPLTADATRSRDAWWMVPWTPVRKRRTNSIPCERNTHAYFRRLRRHILTGGRDREGNCKAKNATFTLEQTNGCESEMVSRTRRLFCALASRRSKFRFASSNLVANLQSASTPGSFGTN